jgi:serine/threonine-protein kinase
MLGEVFGNYRVTAALASGGMGAVYRGEHALIGKPAAIKVLLPEWSANREIVNRFFNEARATTAIRHPGIVEIFDFGHHESGRAYLVMELLDGEPLAARLARVGRIAEPVAVGLIRSIVGALAAAHRAGIVHRDLKPDNVFLVRDPDVPGGERPKLLDFGIAKLGEGPAGTTNVRATRTGMVLGTPTYMAPEQCRGAGTVDARADLYAIGCIFFEMLAGRPPFVGEGAGELMAAHLMTAPERVSVHAPEVSAVVADVIARLLEKAPEARYASANELLVALGGTPADAEGRVMALVTPAMLTPVTVPTTLGGAASQSSPRGTAIGGGKSRRWIGAVGGAIAAAGIAVGVWIGAAGGSSTPSTSTSTTTTASTSTVPTTSTTTSTSTVAAKPVPAAAPVPVPVPVPPPVAVPEPAPTPAPTTPAPTTPAPTTPPVVAKHHHVAAKKPAATTNSTNPATQPPVKPALPALPDSL